MSMVYAGTITPEGDEWWEKIQSLTEDVGNVLVANARYCPDLPPINSAKKSGPRRLGVVVETPFATPRPPSPGSQRSVLHIPVYGMAVGAVVAEAARICAANQFDQIITVASDDWPRGFAPGNKGDRYKEARVAYASNLYGVEILHQMKSKSAAADVADALLLAHWGSSRLPEAEVVVAFDPSMSCTGYAVVTGHAHT